MLRLRDLTYTEIAIRIILSILFGGILGNFLALFCDKIMAAF